MRGNGADEIAEAGVKQSDETVEAGVKSSDEATEAGVKQGDEAALRQYEAWLLGGMSE